MSIFRMIGSLSELELGQQTYTVKQVRKLLDLEDCTYCDCPELCWPLARGMILHFGLSLQ